MTIGKLLASALTAGALSLCLAFSPSAYAQDTGGDTMGKAHDSMSKDSMGTDTMGKDSMGKDTMGKDTMGKDTMHKDTMGHDSMSKGGTDTDTTK
ncbi:MAG TPA: pentapeptide MXKDX repeat protein [Alphaproteobacteria bacterium]|nr:pentapeptide MXKDX repeat protein [Alphaproteobacteria bacterium]